MATENARLAKEEKVAAKAHEDEMARANTLPRYRKTVKPEYPSEAVSQRQEGVVLLSVQVGPDGRVQGITLKRSSGFPLLDQATISRV
jgi:outer membrane biosynthesis protein TonB